jgi:hypothetical protein
MSEWNKPVFAQPGSGMSVITDEYQSHLNTITAPPRTGMSVLVSQEMLALAAASGANQVVLDVGKSNQLLKAIRGSLTSIFDTLGNIVLEEIVLVFRTRSGEDLLINPFDQGSIDAAKAAAPGEGIGPAVSAHLVGLMGRGLISDANLLPAEYRHLGALIGTTPAHDEVILANCSTSILLKNAGTNQ